jgi:hypothetical protein
MPDRTRITRHFLQSHHRFVDLFRRRARIVYDLFESASPFGISYRYFTTSLVLNYFADLCHI